MNAEPTPQREPGLCEILARLETALTELEALGLTVPCLHLSMAVDLLRIEAKAHQNG